ncbi:MAG: type III pantothenate kinase [Pseudomonadota bacterium]
MILTLDVGNSQIFGGVFGNDDLLFKFRRSSKQGFSSDEIGLFLRDVCRAKDIDPKSIKDVSICSVVPDMNHSLRNGCLKYFDIEPFFLKPGTKTGLKIKYRNPLEVGADRIANAIAAINIYPNQNIIIADFGTANTICAVNSSKEFLGGIIFPGLRLSMEVLEAKTSKLPAVEIVVPSEIIGKSTIEGIQSGLYYYNFAAIQYLTKEIKKNYFNNSDAVVIGTGGFGSLFEGQSLFDTYLPDLVLMGLNDALKMNRKEEV